MKVEDLNRQIVVGEKRFVKVIQGMHIGASIEVKKVQKTGVKFDLVTFAYNDGEYYVRMKNLDHLIKKATRVSFFDKAIVIPCYSLVESGERNKPNYRATLYKTATI